MNRQDPKTSLPVPRKLVPDDGASDDLEQDDLDLDENEPTVMLSGLFFDDAPRGGPPGTSAQAAGEAPAARRAVGRLADEGAGQPGSSSGWPRIEPTGGPAGGEKYGAGDPTCVGWLPTLSPDDERTEIEPPRPDLPATSTGNPGDRTHPMPTVPSEEGDADCAPTLQIAAPNPAILDASRAESAVPWQTAAPLATAPREAHRTAPPPSPTLLPAGRRPTQLAPVAAASNPIPHKVDSARGVAGSAATPAVGGEATSPRLSRSHSPPPAIRDRPAADAPAPPRLTRSQPSPPAIPDRPAAGGTAGRRRARSQEALPAPTIAPPLATTRAGSESPRGQSPSAWSASDAENPDGGPDHLETDDLQEDPSCAPEGSEATSVLEVGPLGRQPDPAAHDEFDELLDSPALTGTEPTGALQLGNLAPRQSGFTADDDDTGILQLERPGPSPSGITAHDPEEVEATGILQLGHLGLRPSGPTADDDDVEPTGILSPVRLGHRPSGPTADDDDVEPTGILSPGRLGHRRQARASEEGKHPNRAADRAPNTTRVHALPEDPAKRRRRAVIMVVLTALLAGFVFVGITMLPGDRPTTAELQLLYPYGFEGATGPRGEVAPGAASVTFTYLQHVSCNRHGEANCLQYQYSSGNFSGMMILRKDEDEWRRVSDEGMPFRPK